VYPAIAIADALRAHADITFVGTRDRLEATIVPKAGYPLVTVPAQPLSRQPLAAVYSGLTNVAGLAQSLRAVVRLQPDIVIATGGYVCFPVVTATRMLRSVGRTRAPIALLEANVLPGLTSRLVAPFVDEVWGAYDEPDPRFAGKFVRTGVPVRSSISSLPARADAVARLGLDPESRTLLVMGGSQGARRINDAISQLQDVPENWQILLVAGNSNVGSLAQNAAGAANVPVHVVPYLDDPADAYAVADLVLARAGASTLAELAELGLPAILVPYPHATDGHQWANARAAARSGAAVVIDDADLTGGGLSKLLAETCNDARLSAMRAAARADVPTDAVKAIVARIRTLVSRKNAR
jgi:UDP-N-acetylglucosamine--N-acetylmuramyl-(pentapeptide) pyrophosphoryl-undecaprenol N-acetylglucosamine transferase